MFDGLTVPPSVRPRKRRLVRFTVSTHDDTGRLYLICNEHGCTWDVALVDEDLESINDLANEHQAEAHS